MSSPVRASAPPEPRSALPPPLLALCARLEDAGIAAWIQGEGWLDAWLGTRAPRRPAWAIVSLAEPSSILAALPRAVVTAEHARRMTQASACGPIDVIAAPDRSIETALLSFGLAPLALAWRPRGEVTCDPGGALAALEQGRFPLLEKPPNPFAAAPRRYWIAGQLIAEYGLQPTAELLAAALTALPETAGRMPEGAPVRRAVERMLASPEPGRALAFLRESGALTRLLPDYDGARETLIDALPAGSALRFAALLRGPNAADALARLRMPQTLARRIARLLEAHPLDRTSSATRDAQARRLLNRFRPEEIEGLVAWRRLELEHDAAGATPRLAPREIELARSRLSQLETALERVRRAASTSESVRALALGGSEVMRILAAGPGRHVGRALAHLAAYVAADPARNTAPLLEAELLRWQREGGANPVR